MINSMTGFACIEYKCMQGTFTWEIKSVNQRFLENYFKLPEEFKSIESSIREEIKQNLERGKIECTLRFNPNIECNNLNFNTDLAQKLVKNAEEICSYLSNKTIVKLNPMDILAWPGVMNSSNFDNDELKNNLLTSFKQALAQLKTSRSREGEKLQTILLDKLDKVEVEVSKVKSMLPDVLAWQKNKIETAFKDLSLTVDPSRIEQEIIIIAQRLDVAEELDRLISHVSETRAILKKGGSCGRRLDFMMQEFNRESNTLASKSINHQITNSAIELKVLIEQMREQIQNIE